MKRTSYSKKPVAKYRGRGTLTFADGVSGKCLFRAQQSNCGDVFLLCYGFQNDLSNKLLANFYPTRFQGKTNKGELVLAECFSHYSYVTWMECKQPSAPWDAFRLGTLSITVDSIEPSHTLKFGLTNLELHGTEIIDHRIGSAYSKLPLRLPLKNGIREIEIWPLPHYALCMMELQAKKEICVTCEAIVPVHGGFDSAQVQEMISDLCYILSVARGIKVQWVYCDSYDNSDRLLSRTHHNRVTRPYSNLRVVRAIDAGGDSTKQLIENAFPIFSTRKTQYRLDSGTIDMYLDAKSEQDFIETRGAKMVVAIEALKNVAICNKMAEYILEPTIFKNCLKPRIKSDMCKILKEAQIDVPLRKTIYGNIEGLNRKPFRDLIVHLFNEVGLIVSENDITRFVNNRNSLIHTGNFFCNGDNPAGIKEYKETQNLAIYEFFFLLNFLDKIFLRMLGYSGKYWSWRDPGNPSLQELE
ncbi:MAG: hypothetical protein NT018_09600 [Armatimonadetes bacterium]|nr:hypothetical protein [Armatimonadota bacterium]